MSSSPTKSLTLTSSQERYLLCIYRLGSGGKPVRARDVARDLEVSRPSVSRAVAQLKRKGLVRHEAYGYVELTPEAREWAHAISRQRDCLQRLLVEILALEEDEARAQVERLERIVDDALLPRLETLLDFATSSDAWIRRLQHRIRIRLDTLSSHR